MRDAHITGISSAARSAAFTLAALGALSRPALAESTAPPGDSESTSESAPGANAEGRPGDLAGARPLVTAERPYRLGVRPRPQGVVQASVADEDVARWNIGGTGDPSFPSNRAGFHPAPRVLVDVGIRSGTLPKRGKSKGTLSEPGLVAQARNAGYWPFRLCFEEGLRRDPSLRGKTRVRFTVESNGRVKSEKVAFTELKDHSVAKCLAARVRAMHFSPAPPRRVHADATVDLNPGDAPLPGADPVSPSDATTTQVDEAIRGIDFAAALRRVEGCYAEALARDPKLWGRVAILLDVDADGRVRAAAEHESRFPDRAVTACALDGFHPGTPLFMKPPVSPARLIWAVRLGAPPASEASPGHAMVVPAPGEPKRTVAEAAPPRVPVAK